MSDPKAPPPLTSEIEELERLLEKATPGPWKASAPDGSYHDVIRIFADADPEGALPVAVCPQRQSAIMSVLAGQTNATTEAAANAQLIAAIPRLLSSLKLSGGSGSAAGADSFDALADMESRKDAAYLERNQVVAALASAFPSGIARTAIEGWSEDWHGAVYVDLPTGQASWHYHDSHAHLFAHLPPYAGQWDGHTTEQKYERLAALNRRAPPSTAEWLPISTAPKDGTKIIAGYFNELGKHRTVMARFYPAGTLESDHEESGFAEEGWYEESETHDEILPIREPTHWMHLPPAPSQEGASEGEGGDLS